MRERLAQNLSEFLPPDAVAFLIKVWDLIQFLDDWVDGDAVDRDDKDRTIWLALVGLPGDPFLSAHAATLLPVLASMVLTWKASDTVERQGRELEKAYVWRAGFYDVVLQTAMVVHGVDFAMKNAHDILCLYGEPYEAYAGEFHA